MQEKINQLGIKYNHVIELAPTLEIMDLQKEIDLQKRVPRRKRRELAPVFTVEYKNKILSKFNFDNFIKNLNQTGANRVTLFCVEEHAEACHRSIIADKLSSLNYKVTHL